MVRWVLNSILWLSTAGAICASTQAAPPESLIPKDNAKASAGPANIDSPTWGGPQFWADELVFHEYRIQRHVYSGHCRLLDDREIRRAWGTFSHCRDMLDEFKRVHDLPPLSRKVLVSLHGLFRTRGSMQPLGDYVSRNSEYQVLHVGYPSTRADLATHAAALARVVENLDGVEEISFVSHSLGGLVLRHFLGDQTDPATGKRPDPRIKRIVMIGPPNNGSQFAEGFRGNQVYGLVTGPSGKSLAADWKNVSQRLAVPQCEFGIIAGGSGYNPLVRGDDDLIVSVDETRLAGARDFFLSTAPHAFLRTDRQVYECTLRFLEHGHFVSEESRQPILPATARRASRP